MNIKGAKLHEYQAWLRWMQNMLNTAPMQREPLDMSPQPNPVAVRAGTMRRNSARRSSGYDARNEID